MGIPLNQPTKKVSGGSSPLVCTPPLHGLSGSSICPVAVLGGPCRRVGLELGLQEVCPELMSRCYAGMNAQQALASFFETTSLKFPWGCDSRAQACPLPPEAGIQPARCCRIPWPGAGPCAQTSVPEH